MIVLKITNASDVMAGKIGKFLESLTPARRLRSDHH